MAGSFALVVVPFLIHENKKSHRLALSCFSMHVLWKLLRRLTCLSTCHGVR